MKNIRFRLIPIILLWSSLAYGHGDDRPGPHGGEIKMPGSFHVELLDLGLGNFKIYLLDMNLRNPTVENSMIVANMKRDSKEKLECKSMEDYFKCSFTKRKLTKDDALTILATRKGIQGVPVDYKLPLKFGK